MGVPQLGRARRDLEEAQGYAESGEAALGHDRRLLIFDRRGARGGLGARTSSRSGQPIRRDGARIFATGSAAGGMPKTVRICLRFTIGTRGRRAVTGRTTRTR